MKILPKAIFFLGVFSVLHFGYELTNWTILIPFCGTDESVFEHLKMGFWAYFIVSAIEYFISKRKIQIGNFWFSRILSAVFVPWFIVVIWYIVPAIIGHVESLIVELIWAFVVTFISGIMGCILERSVQQIPLNKGLGTLIIVMFVFSVIFYTRFSFSKPWVDLFINPMDINI
ncbi:MAG TPA: DUF6512 family protein [Pseudothermotoga sp.]|nr:DUF6512 family protein [Pseudothermotoga sp.]HOK82657.1 DUF6512 family protein [Pseudothermotoga sp.]HPP70418.1 DUF6512 family protein [Pseudothermotoga sp.]